MREMTKSLSKISLKSCSKQTDYEKIITKRERERKEERMIEK